jgi:hypothetical protein
MSLMNVPKSAVNIRLPLSFILFALLSIFAASWVLVFQPNLLAIGIFRIPMLWMGAHLFVLGFCAMAAMGAMYQLVPVAFLTPIWSVKLGFVQMITTLLGVLLLALGLGFNMALLHPGGSLVILGAFLFVFQMGMTLKTQKEKNMMTALVGTALTCLLITVLLGFTMVLNITGHYGWNEEKLLSTHLVLGLSGWFTMLIFGFSYKMLPMFALSHGFTTTLNRYIYTIYVIGLATTVTSIWTSSSILLFIGLLCQCIGFVLFAYHMRQILKKKLKKTLDPGFIFSIRAIYAGATLHVFFLTIPFGIGAQWISLLVFFYFVCWILFAIMGYLFKIVPFLWWTEKYSEKVGKEPVPLLKDMMSEKAGKIVFTSLWVILAGLIIGMGLKLTFLLSLVLICFAILVTWYCILIILSLR